MKSLFLLFAFPFAALATEALPEFTCLLKEPYNTGFSVVKQMDFYKVTSVAAEAVVVSDNGSDLTPTLKVSRIARKSKRDNSLSYSGKLIEANFAITVKAEGEERQQTTLSFKDGDRSETIRTDCVYLEE